MDFFQPPTLGHRREGPLSFAPGEDGAVHPSLIHRNIPTGVAGSNTTLTPDMIPNMNYSRSDIGNDENSRVWEEENISSSEEEIKRPRPSYKSLLWIPLVIILNLCVVLYFYIPLHKKLNISMIWNLDDLKKVYGAITSKEAEKHSFELWCLFCSLYLFNQISCMPGTVFLNIISGSMMGTIYDFLLSFEWFKVRVSKLSAILQGYRKKGGFKMTWFLISLRLFPLTPNWFVNISGPVLGITATEQIYSVFIGMIPFNYITVHAGLLLSELTTVNDIYQPKTVFLLLFLSLLSLIPAIMRRFEKPKDEKEDAMKSDLPTTLPTFGSNTFNHSFKPQHEFIHDTMKASKGMVVNSVKFLSKMIEQQSNQYFGSTSKAFSDSHKIV
ncbi:hypothetical protein C9374_004226 [Naegleria lovaniensis]|uniref:Golgi apparatus membrane protein TVP38 n=1 Tax=Naegleria lovaniensis TaxID=51637 RepID=A0AA88KLD9_NAELO|nr:uncharacterized protein C9374_004226 [Naegleria lovaniensis]KAG2383555.1 hypothetical protein C9374_004226 [Naegleria lovaniensis]